jgi:hypothetical protein
MGAESTLSGLITLLSTHEVFGEEALNQKKSNKQSQAIRVERKIAKKNKRLGN